MKDNSNGKILEIFSKPLWQYSLRNNLAPVFAALKNLQNCVALYYTLINDFRHRQTISETNTYSTELFEGGGITSQVLAASEAINAALAEFTCQTLASVHFQKQAASTGQNPQAFFPSKCGLFCGICAAAHRRCPARRRGVGLCRRPAPPA